MSKQLVLIFLFPILCHAQKIEIDLKKPSGYFTMSLGTTIHLLTYVTSRGTKLNDKQKIGVVFNSTIGVGLYILSFEKKSRKYSPRF